MGITAFRSDTSSPTTSGVFALDMIRESDLPVVGGRALRTAIALQAGLPVPAGSVVTAPLMDAHPGPHIDHVTTVAREFETLFDDLSRSGRTPLTIRLSSVSDENGCANHVQPANNITTASDLMHAVRRFSVTASLLGDRAAAMVQRDVEPAQSGKFVVGAQRSVSPLGPAGADIRRRLADLQAGLAEVFSGVRRASWSIDSANRLWLTDVGPGQGRSSGWSSRPANRSPLDADR